jgi:hypothetical protein
MSPRWASVGPCHLYFYAHERHRRPHVDVRGPGFDATLDVETGELLAGRMPPQLLAEVRRLLRRHRREALAAFEATLAHEFPGTLEEQLKRSRDD